MIWITDVNGEYVAGDKKFHSCGNRTTLDIDTESDDAYLLLATTVGELKTKYRGPFEYLSSINHKNEFSTFKGALSIDLHKIKSTPPGTTIIGEADATGNDFGPLGEQMYSLESLLSVNKEERNIKLKEAIKNLSSRVWYSISSLVKDTISQEVVRRRQLRFLVSMVRSYRTLELFCTLKPRKQDQTIKSQVTKKIIKESNGRLDEKI
ncbi:hypothetical protein C1646_665169 [Rhizophagus diaphanus]|nr:hypothetical protein C1646_665169 [Rhizophagus diaphanus] [Rhizophagus sp. MUCL 43196]